MENIVEKMVEEFNVQELTEWTGTTGVFRVDKFREQLTQALTEAHQAGKKAGIDEAVEIVEGMKKPLWNDDVKKYTNNIARHNTLDDTIKALQDKNKDHFQITVDDKYDLSTSPNRTLLHTKRS